MATPPRDEPGPPGFVLERNQRLSRSLIWGYQRAYYERQGIEAWRQEFIPNFITSNPIIGRAYGQVVLGWMRDWCAASRGPGGRLAAPEPSQPFYLVELGSGAGRFAYHFLEAFRRMHALSQLRDVGFRYVMTDLSERNLEFWLSHPRLQPFLEEGLLDIARFDAERDEQLVLRRSGTVLAPGSLGNPLALVANYFFDSISQDAFTVTEDGGLLECLVSVTAPQPEPRLDAPDLLDRVTVSFEDHPVQGAAYDDPDLDRIVEHYREHLSEATVQIPSTALRCIRRLQRLSGDRLLLLSGDKGQASQEELQERWPGIGLTRHSGAFSLMVNFDAIGQYFRNRDGHVLRPVHRHIDLHVGAFLLGQPPDGHGETELAYEEAIERSGPDDYSTLLKCFENALGSMTLEELLATVRWSGWDSGIMMNAFPMLMAQVESASLPLQNEVCWAIQQVWEKSYVLDGEDELAFHLGMLLYAMGRSADALTFFEHSLRLDPDGPGALYNLGLCHVQLRQDAQAKECFERALAVDPGLTQAQEMLAQLQSPDWRQGQEDADPDEV